MKVKSQKNLQFCSGRAGGGWSRNLVGELEGDCHKMFSENSSSYNGPIKSE